jgi:hypothetical protein
MLQKTSAKQLTRLCYFFDDLVVSGASIQYLYKNYHDLLKILWIYKTDFHVGMEEKRVEVVNSNNNYKRNFNLSLTHRISYFLLSRLYCKVWNQIHYRYR